MDDYATQWLDLEGHRSFASTLSPNGLDQLPIFNTDQQNILAPQVLISPPLSLECSPSCGSGPIRPISNTIKRRRRLSSQEATRLNSFFDRCPRPTAAQRQQLSLQLGLSTRAIQIWFQNRRAKVKRDQMDTSDGMLLFKPTVRPMEEELEDKIVAPPSVVPSSSSTTTNPSVMEDSLDMLLGTEDWLGKALGLC